MLLNITISEFDWAILAFAITELIVFIKFIVSLHTKSKLMESELVGLKEQNKMQADQFEELRTSIDASFTRLEDFLIKSNEQREANREQLFQEIGKIEDKFEEYDKQTQKRIGELAQGLVRAETKLEQK